MLKYYDFRNFSIAPDESLLGITCGIILTILLETA